MVYSIRRATRNDSRRVWEIRNSTASRRNSLNHKRIKYTDHDQWFRRQYFGNAENRCYVLTGNKRVIGYCRLDKIKKDRRISIGIDQSFQSKGLGQRLLSGVIKKNKQGGRINAEIQLANQASLHLFKKNKFRIARHDKNNYYLVYP